jgi:hypothetical protein
MKMNKLIGPIGAFLMAVAAPMAHADLQLSYQIDALPTVNCGTAANPNPTVTCGNIVAPLTIITLSADSTSPGSGNSAEEDSATVALRNNDSVTHTITINVASNDFTQPTAPPGINFLSHIGGTVSAGVAGSTLTFQSCLDTGNTLAGCPGTAATTPASPAIDTTGSFDNDKSGVIALLGSPYAIDEVITLVLAPGEHLNFSASTTLTGTPEPMSVALLGGALVLAGGVMKRRRKLASKV